MSITHLDQLLHSPEASKQFTEFLVCLIVYRFLFQILTYNIIKNIIVENNRVVEKNYYVAI